MKLTKEQQNLINRYNLMPSFLQNRNLRDILYKLEMEGFSREEASKIIFQNSAQSTRIKNYEEFLSNTYSNSEISKEILSFLSEIPVKQQDKILSKLDYSYLASAIGKVSPDLQEKYFEKFLNSGFKYSLNYVGELDDNVKKNHEQEILSNPNANSQVLKDMWNILSPESKSKYYDLSFKPEAQMYFISQTWDELDEQSQQKYIGKIINSYNDNYKYFIDDIWLLTKENVQSQYLNVYADMIRKNDGSFLKFWENTSDNVQNSNIGKELIKNADIQEKKELYKGSNSKLQSELLIQDIKHYVNRNFDYNSPIYSDLINTNVKVFEENFQNIFEQIKPNIDALELFLRNCPDNIKEKNSSIIGKYFSSELEYFTKSGIEKNQNLLIDSARYLDVESCKNIFENFFSQNSDNDKEYVSIEDRTKFTKLSKTMIMENFWQNVNLENQKKIYTDFIEKGKLKDKLYRFYNLTNFNSYEEEKEYFIKYFEKYSPDSKDDVVELYEKIHSKNDNIRATISFNFIDSNLTDILTEEQILRITSHSEIQEEIFKYKDNINFINAFTSMLDTDENWTLAADNILKNIKSGQYDELMQSLKQNNISPQYYENLCVALSKPNYFEIKTKEDIEQYFDNNGKKNQVLLSILNGEDNELPESIKKLNKNDLKKFAISEYLYGMDLEELSSYQTHFQEAGNLNVENAEYIKKLIKGISGITTAKPEELDEIAHNIVEGKLMPTEYTRDIHLDSKAINLFCNAFENGVYNPENSKKDKVQPIIYNGGKIDIYKIHDEFKMLARVEGAYTSNSGDVLDYKKYYNSPNIYTHGNCESVIGQDQIGLARNRNSNIIVGYDLVPRNSILVSGPYDLGTTNVSLAPFYDNRISKNYKILWIARDD